MISYMQSFLLLFLYRYARFVVNCISHWTFRPIPLPDNPTYDSEDITVIIPSIDGDGYELRQTILSCLQTNPLEVILVTVHSSLQRARKMVDSLSTKKVRVLSIDQANKRRQICEAIPQVKTKITIFADDDVVWPTKILPWILAPFEDPLIGGVGTCQRLQRTENSNVWDLLGASYLERRNFDISACTHLDGGLPCLSGRTVAYRTSILQNLEFTTNFTNETWGTFQLNADDDNFMTRWMVSHGWKTYVQYHKECEVKTTLEGNPKFIKQCLRWSRSNWRSNLRSMFVEGHIWARHPWSSYAVFLTTLTAWSIPTDYYLFYWLYKSTQALPVEHQYAALGMLAFWTAFAKFLKHSGHFIRYPEDVIYFPVIIFFGYAHAFIKFWAMCTLDVTTWGSREGADTHDYARLIPIKSCEQYARIEKYSLIV